MKIGEDGAIFRFYELEDGEDKIAPGVDMFATEVIGLTEQEISECRGMSDVFLSLYEKAESTAISMAKATGEAFAFHMDEWDDAEDVWRVPSPA